MFGSALSKYSPYFSECAEVETGLGAHSEILRSAFQSGAIRKREVRFRVQRVRTHAPLLPIFIACPMPDSPKAPSTDASTVPIEVMPQPWIKAQQDREDEEIRKRYPKYYQEREKRNSKE